MHSCIHLTLVFYDLKSSKRLDVISIWSFDEFSSLYLRFLNIKPISYLTMVCYHQNPIRRTLGLTISYFYSFIIFILIFVQLAFVEFFFPLNFFKIIMLCLSQELTLLVLFFFLCHFVINELTMCPNLFFWKHEKNITIHVTEKN